VYKYLFYNINSSVDVHCFINIRYKRIVSSDKSTRITICTVISLRSHYLAIY